MESQFWVVKGVSAPAYNAHAGVYVLGVPQPTAVSGWIHAWLRGISKAAGVPLGGDSKFVYAVDHYSSPTGISLNTRTAKNTDRADKAIPAAIIDRARSHVTISIIVEWTSFSNSDRTMITRERIKSAIEKTRLMGASLFIDSLDNISLENSLPDALRKLGASSFILSDASSVLRRTLEEERVDDPSMGIIEAMANMLSRPLDGSYKPRYVPVLSGYQTLDSSTRRPELSGSCIAPHGSLPVDDFRPRREQYQHRHVEPILSTGLFQSKASALKSLRENRFHGLWRLVENEEDGLFVLVGTCLDEDLVDIDDISLI